MIDRQNYDLARCRPLPGADVEPSGEPTGALGNGVSVITRLELRFDLRGRQSGTGRRLPTRQPEPGHLADDGVPRRADRSPDLGARLTAIPTQAEIRNSFISPIECHQF
jgi:hypothetical protein